MHSSLVDLHPPESKEKATNGLRSNFWIAAGVFAFIATVYLALFFVLDNSLIMSGNGLWKSVRVSSWASGDASRFLEAANLIYFPVYGWLTSLVPNDWMGAYCLDGGDCTFLKMAFVNVFFGSLSSALIFLISNLLARNVFLAIFSALIHASFFYVLNLSISSEDAIAAYSAYVLGVYFLFRYLTGGQGTDSAIAAIAFTISYLFHWTFLPAIIGASGAGIVVHATRLNMLLKSALLLVAPAMICIFVASLVFDVDVLNIVYPQKAHASGWTGYKEGNIWNMLAALPQYVIRGRNVNAWYILHDRYFLLYAGTGALVVALFLAFVTSLVKRMADDRALVACGSFLVAGFCVGELMLIMYAAPRDPQFQIQPMLWLALCVSFFHAWFGEVRWFRRVLTGCLVAVVALLVTANGSYLTKFKGADSRSLSETQRFWTSVQNREFLLIWAAASPLSSWLWATRGVDLTSHLDFRTVVVGSVEKSTVEMTRDIQSRILQAFEKNQVVLIGPVWNMKEDEFLRRLADVQRPDLHKAAYRVIETWLRPNFEASNFSETKWGDIYVLTPKGP